jgi:D-alanine--poly(phosphoribitol) ligase subunit 2
MFPHAVVAQTVFTSVEAFNQMEDHRLDASSDVPLLGAHSQLDSLSLVRFIITVERQVETDLNVAVSLTDERAMSQRNSPYRTIGTLIDYITATLNEQAAV